MVNAEEMSHDKTRIVLEKFKDKGGHNTVVHRVQVLDFERRVVLATVQWPRSSKQVLQHMWPESYTLLPQVQRGPSPLGGNGNGQLGSLDCKSFHV